MQAYPSNIDWQMPIVLTGQQLQRFYNQRYRLAHRQGAGR